MTYDGLSGLQMEYNAIDLSAKVISGDTTLVNYCYLADGTKISSLKPSGEGLVYRGPFVYRRSSTGALSLESAECPEGRLTLTKGVLYITDHLGSVRTVIDGSTGAELETSDYSAYGTRCGSTSGSLGSGLTLRDHFTGQEDQTPDFAVPYNDHGARHYNTALRRWMTPDPLSEKYYGMSPYNYCGGNPVSIIDRSGLDIEIVGMNESSVVISFAELDASINLSSLGIDYDFSGNYVLSGDDVLSASLDIAGIFDPTGIADGANVLLLLNNGDYLGAGISLCGGLVPIVGDLAKGFKITKDVRILAESVKAVRYTKDNFRKNLIKLTGVDPKDMQAHHLFPQKFRDVFDNAGVNVDDPNYGRWLESTKHSQGASLYNKEWEKIKDNIPGMTEEELLSEAKRIMKMIYGE